MSKDRARHDIKNALATAVLAADTLTNHDDANVRQYARLIIEAVDTALKCLNQHESLEEDQPESAINSTL